MYRYYPLARGHVTHVELSTPLTTAHFIGAPGGASYGLEWTPAHFDADLQAVTLSTMLSTSLSNTLSTPRHPPRYPPRYPPPHYPPRYAPPRYPTRYHHHVTHHGLNPVVMSNMAPYMSSRAVCT